jgi:Leucine-rich repeat (LRR) protein
MTGLNAMVLANNNLKGTIPSSLASLTQLATLNLDANNLNGTIPSSLASLTRLTNLDLEQNALTGLVPPLPFKQYSGACRLDNLADCVEPNCNHFKCPLPAGIEQCEVHCK